MVGGDGALLTLGVSRVGEVALLHAQPQRGVGESEGDLVMMMLILPLLLMILMLLLMVLMVLP